MLRLRDKHGDQHLKIISSSLVAEEQTHRLIHPGRKPTSQIRHDDARDDKSVELDALLWREDLPDGDDDLRPGILRAGVRTRSGLLESHVLEQVSHRHKVSAKRTRLETNSAGGARDVVPSDDCESAGRGSHNLGTSQGDAVVEPLDGGERRAVFEVRANSGRAGETAGSEGADGLLAASGVGGGGTGVLVLVCGEQGLAVHGAGAGSGLFEPGGDALPAEDVVARQFHWGVHLAVANGAHIGGVFHWCQTSGEEFCAGRERHVRSAWVSEDVDMCGVSSFTCIRVCRNESGWLLLEMYSRSAGLMYLRLHNASFVG